MIDLVIDMKITLIAACSDLGVNIDGAKDGANKLLEHFEKNKKVNIRRLETTASKEYKKDNLAKNLSAVNDFNNELYRIEGEILEKKQIPITLGGDHSVVIASSLAVQKHFGEVGMIWIDSHGDFNTFETTVTGNLHGLPLACLTGYYNEKLRPFHPTPCINPEYTVIVGVRDLDSLEIQNLVDARVNVFTTRDIQKYGVDCVMNQAFEIANRARNGVYVSYDLDVIDPIVAPGVSIKAKNGINQDEALEIAKNITQHKKMIKSVDLVEFNPLNDVDDKTFNLANEILEHFIDEFSK